MTGICEIYQQAGDIITHTLRQGYRATSHVIETIYISTTQVLSLIGQKFADDIDS